MHSFQSSWMKDAMNEDGTLIKNGLLKIPFIIMHTQTEIIDLFTIYCKILMSFEKCLAGMIVS